MKPIHIDNDKIVALLEAPAFGLTLDQLAKMGIEFNAELGSTKKHRVLYDMTTGLDAVVLWPQADPKQRDKPAR